MSNTRPPLARQHTRSTEAKRDEGLDEGFSFVDTDGKRLSVRVRDVKGRHDAALHRAIGLDFMGLLDALSRRQGLDLLAAVVWFGRLVHTDNAGTYEDTLADFSYSDVLALDIDEADKGADPEA